MNVLSLIQERILKEEVDRLRNQVLDSRATVAFLLDMIGTPITMTDRDLSEARMSRRVVMDANADGSVTIEAISSAEFAEANGGAASYSDLQPPVPIDAPMTATVIEADGSRVRFQTTWGENFVLFLQAHGLEVGQEVGLDRDSEQGIIRGVKTSNAREG